jgi:hypothetical protein
MLIGRVSVSDLNSYTFPEVQECTDMYREPG